MLCLNLLILSSFCLFAPAQSVQPIWLGEWNYLNYWQNPNKEGYDFETYVLTIQSQNNTSTASLKADGRMLFINAILRFESTPNNIKFYVRSQEPGMPSFTQNDLLFELAKSNKSILTIWHRLRPSNTKKSGFYFKKLE